MLRLHPSCSHLCSQKVEGAKQGAPLPLRTFPEAALDPSYSPLATPSHKPTPLQGRLGNGPSYERSTQPGETSSEGPLAVSATGLLCHQEDPQHLPGHCPSWPPSLPPLSLDGSFPSSRRSHMHPSLHTPPLPGAMTCLPKSQQVAESSAGENPTSTEPGFAGNQIQFPVPDQEETPHRILHPTLSLVTPQDCGAPSHHQ